MRRRLSYANVTATLALVFAMSGGAIAANSYLINSTKQINPKVLKKLKGNAGKAGANGANGANGAGGPQGAQGKEGSQGKEGGPGKEGKEGKEGQRGPSSGFQAFVDSVGLVTSEKTVATLALPAGSYLVTTKLWGLNNSSERLLLECSLVNDLNGDSDRIEGVLEPKGSTSWFGRTTEVLESASTFNSAGHWLVKCFGSGTGVSVSNLKIQAVQVGTLSNTNG